MKQSRYFLHGEYINPRCQAAAIAPAKSDSSDRLATRPDGKSSNILKRFSKSVRASEAAISFELIKTTYENAIEYTARLQSLRGMSLLAGVLSAILGFGVGIYRFNVDFERTSHNILDSISIIFPLAFFAFGLVMIVWTSRLELFCPEDEPIIFDRKQRKIYRMFRETKPGFTGLFRHWPMYAAEYEWDLVDAEHVVTVATTGATLTRYNSLVFVVRKSSTDSSCIDSFNVGASAELGVKTVPAIWEHIRRFMEENGPATPEGELPMRKAMPNGIRQSVGAVGPFGPDYVRWWKEQLPFMVLIHVLLPVFLPFFLLWGLMNWLSNKTATRTAWPDVVATALKS